MDEIDVLMWVQVRVGGVMPPICSVAHTGEQRLPWSSPQCEAVFNWVGVSTDVAKNKNPLGVDTHTFFNVSDGHFHGIDSLKYVLIERSSKNQDLLKEAEITWNVDQIGFILCVCLVKSSEEMTK